MSNFADEYFPMPKDLKFGMALGLIIMAALLIWLSTRPALSPDSRMLQAHLERLRQDKNAPEMSQQAHTPKDQSPQSIQNQFHSPTLGLQDSNSATAGTSVNIQPSKRENVVDSGQLEKIKTTRFHIVRRGETLSGISSMYYGSASRWPELLTANRFLKDPNKIRAGMKLAIPK
ncbi:MAG: LysM peptidoglycan-binding domain-containing protein [Sedimentisphaerales bacterium]|nr:LysM peptidoglycan-binding domain-containing protein [Sedimentisphaerales bacterium]